MSADAIRAYVRTLRRARGLSQPVVAEAIGIGVRTYKGWEMGETKDIKTPHLLRAVREVGGSLDQLAMIDDQATADDGEALARAWLETHGHQPPPPAQVVDLSTQFCDLLQQLAAGVDARAAAQKILDRANEQR
jgi:transcriptional regulator with XRE-family HTH domain